jgi:hypothetical protein
VNWLLLQISEVGSLARIVVVWNHQLLPPPHADNWPKISKPLKVIMAVLIYKLLYRCVILVDIL